MNACVRVCGGIWGLVNMTYTVLIVSKLSDGFRCDAQFKGMEMCLWKPYSGERWCVIFSLPEDNTPSDSTLMLCSALRQSHCSLLPFGASLTRQGCMHACMHKGVHPKLRLVLEFCIIEESRERSPFVTVRAHFSPIFPSPKISLVCCSSSAPPPPCLSHSRHTFPAPRGVC